VGREPHRGGALELRRHTGPLWRDGRLAGELAEALAGVDRLVAIGDAPRPAVLLGVPHHAPVGVERIAMGGPGGGRVADENAVLYALVCHDLLRRRGIASRLLVACQARDHDPNKDDASPYCRAVLDAAPRLLLECHGAGPRAPHDLELSAGRNLQARPLAFARRLVAALGAGFAVAAQARAGTRTALLVAAAGREAPVALRFPALRTRSLALAGRHGFAALHLEAKPRFRSAGPRRDAPTASGARLGRALAAALTPPVR